MKYNAKPMTVDAIQWNGDNTAEIKTFLGLTRGTPKFANKFSLTIGDTDLFVTPTDWIVKFPDGSVSVMADADFKARFNA